MYKFEKNKSFHHEEQRICVNLIPIFVMEKFNKDNCELIESSWYARAFMTIYLNKRGSGKIERKTTRIVKLFVASLASVGNHQDKGGVSKLPKKQIP